MGDSIKVMSSMWGLNSEAHSNTFLSLQSNVFECERVGEIFLGRQRQRVVFCWERVGSGKWPRPSGHGEPAKLLGCGAMAEELQKIVCGADEFPLCRDALQTAHAKTAKPAGFFDLPKHGLHDHFALGV